MERLRTVFDYENTIFEWKYCPLCGEKLSEIHPGDYGGSTVCDGENCYGVPFGVINVNTVIKVIEESCRQGKISKRARGQIRAAIR